MSKKSIKWLYDELPDLVSKSVISSDTASKLKDHYKEQLGQTGRNIALTIFGILGSILIGSGIILLLAHNWSDMTRAVRTVLSIAPLAVAQLVGLWLLAKGKESAAWRESTSAFITMTIASSIALISQTYHIPGDTGAFLLTWSILTIPVIYIFRSVLPTIIYMICITFWAGYQQNMRGDAAMFWLLFLAIIPRIWSEWKNSPYSQKTVLLCWSISTCLCVATGISLEKVLPGLWIIIYSSMFSILYLAGSYWFSEAESDWKKPFIITGVAGISIMTLLLSYVWPWEEIGWSHYRYGARFHEMGAIVDYLFTALLPIIAIVLLVMAVRRGEKTKILFGSLPIMSIIGYCMISASEDVFIMTMLMNVYMFILGIVTLSAGIRKLSIKLVNGGLFILTALIVARFFDEEFGFVARGIVFIIIGIGFLATNVIIVKRAQKLKIEGGAE